MAESNWRLEGDYFEACNCDFLCICLTTQSRGRPTEGDCKVALAFQVGKGQYGNTTLDGARFVVVARAPGPMAEGNWTVGLILDESLSEPQREALTTILSGQAGGPMAAIAMLTGQFAGIEVRPIRFAKQGLTWTVEVPGLLEMEIEGVTGRSPEEPMWIEGSRHPVNSRLAFARAKRNRADAFGLDWNDASGTKNGHFAPFSWAA